MKPIGELYDEVKQYPYSRVAHDHLIQLLRMNKADYKPLYQARMKKYSHFMITESEIAEFLEDLMTIEDSSVRNALVDEFYCWLIQELPTTRYWDQYIEFCHQTKPDDEVQEILIKALGDTVYDFEGSMVIWEKTIGFALEMYGKSGEEADLIRVWKLILKRLSYPHKTLEESFQNTSSFVSKFFDDEYTEFMKTAQQVYSKTAREQRYIEVHEMNLNSGDAEVWKEYIGTRAAYARDLAQVKTLFYRSLMEADQGWISVWIKYIYCLYSKDNSEELLRDILPKFVKAYPDSCIPYAEIIRNLNLFDDIYPDTKSRVDYLDLKRGSYDDWKVLGLSILAHEKKMGNIVVETIENYFQFAVEHNRDIFHSIERLSISIYELRGEIEKATRLVERLLEKFPDQSELWIFAFEFYKRHGFEYSHATELFEKAVAYAETIDWPERVIQEQLIYELVYGTSGSYKRAVLAADEAMARVLRKRIEETEMVADSPTLTGSPKSRPEGKLVKRKLDHHDKEVLKRQKQGSTTDSGTGSRNREEFTVKVTNLEASTTEAMLQSVFADCQVKKITIYLNQNHYEAVLEFETMQNVLAALTKSHKTVGNSQILVQRLVNSIIWVTNFPPTFDESDLTQLFSAVGTVISVRFPHQTSAKARRFCYVEFAESELVAAAISLFNNHTLKDKLDQKPYKLVVKVSEKPTRKPPVFKREVYISNLDFKATEPEVQSFFDPCGAIERVVLPLNGEMKKKGNNNGGFGFVVFNSETSVPAAVAMNGTMFKGRPVNVSPSKAANGPSGAGTSGAGANWAKSVVVFNVSPSAMAEQFQVFLNEALEVAVEKVVMVPEQEAAVVEFRTVGDSGKVSLRVGGLEFRGRELRVGTRDELASASSSSNAPGSSKSQVTRMVPATVRRRRA